MPDWFYRTVSRPLLFLLPAASARSVTLTFLGGLARLPLGPRLIDFLGHLRPDPRLRCSHLGIPFPTLLGLGPYLDSNGIALPALARFGLGFIEIGPVTLSPSPKDAESVPVSRDEHREALCYPDPVSTTGINSLERRIVEASRLGLPVIARLGSASSVTPAAATEECLGIITALSSHVSFFSLATLRTAMAEGWTEADWEAHVQGVLQAARQAQQSRGSVSFPRPRPVLLCLPADARGPEIQPFIEAARYAGVSGFIVDGAVSMSVALPDSPQDTPQAGNRRRVLVGAPARNASLDTVRWLRQCFGTPPLIIASGGIHEPEHALELRAAGADLLQVDSGLVYTGPGLPKRINECLLFLTTRQVQEAREAEVDAGDSSGEVTSERFGEMTWFWTALMGAGMLGGSVLALAIAATRVLLPYDEQFVGLSREQISALNPRLLAFMAHDRISLAGTMVAIGILYSGLSFFGIRSGLHWAQQSVFASAFTGFASFFLFLGFGYLDPFHAFVTACLLQLLLLGVHSKLRPFSNVGNADAPQLRGSRAWRCGLWGQFLLILHSVALLGAGVVISAIGVGPVFVAEDLHFMGTTGEALRLAGPRLVPLIAHDRATLGGMLLSSGLAFLLPALWGYRNGSRWLWWTLLIAGLCAYAAALGVHLGVGYTDAHHLIPAFAGLALFVIALGLSCPFMCFRDAANETAWKHFLPEEEDA